MKNELALKQRIAELEKLLAQKDAHIAALEERWRLAQQKQFGKSAEGFVGDGELFDEVEEIVEAVKAEQQSAKAPRKKPVRKPLPKDLPREQVIYDIDNKICDCCGGELHKMGEDKSEKLEFIPAQIKVIEHICPKYACRHCDKSSTHTPIKQAAMPINKGIATASLLAQLITSKYQYGLSFYRFIVLSPRVHV